MVKTPQSRLGYCVDGVVVFKPNQVRKTSVSPEAKRRLRRKKAPTQCTAPRRLFTQQTNLRIDPAMEDLKNSSKQGDLSKACRAVISMMGARQSFTEMVRILFSPDIENRTAVYYAAHTGHGNLVKVYLGLLVLARIAIVRNVIEDDVLSSTLSFKQWLDKLGYISGFGRFELDLCVLNALNESVKDNIRRNRYDMWQIVNTCSQTDKYTKVAALFPRTILNKAVASAPVLSVTNKQRKRLPSLKIDNDFDLRYRPEDDEYSNLSESYDEFDAYASDEQTSVGNCVTSDDQGCELDDTACPVDVDDTARPVDVDEADNSLVEVLSNMDVLCFLDVSSNSTGDLDVNEVDWEVVSDVGSVITLESLPEKSYRDALTMGYMQKNVTCRSSASQATMQSRKTYMLQSIREHSIEEEACEYDAFFFLEGVKCARGGKKKELFKSNRDTRT